MMTYSDVQRELMRRRYHEQKEKKASETELYEKHGGEKEYYKKVYRSLVKDTFKSESGSKVKDTFKSEV